MELEDPVVDMVAFADENGSSDGGGQLGRDDRKSPDARHALLDREVREAASSSPGIGEVRGVEVGHSMDCEVPDEGLEEIKVGLSGAEGSGDGPVA